MSEADSLRDLFASRFLVVSGKGGVGKTTLATSIGLAFAGRGKRVLLMQFNARDKVGALFGGPPLDGAIRELAPNLWAVNTNPQEAMREYALLVLRVKLLYRAVFENRAVSRFLRMVPGLPELVMLGKAWYHEQERDSAGLPRWDVIVLDAPATGHGLFLLRIPGIVTEALSNTGSRMVRESAEILNLLRDRARTRVLLVTLGEEMPVNETLEYVARLREELDVPLGPLFANAIYPRHFTDREIAELRQLRDSHGKADDLRLLLDAALFRQDRTRMQAEHLHRLAHESGLPVVELPYDFDPTRGRAMYDRLAARIEEQAAGGLR